MTTITAFVVPASRVRSGLLARRIGVPMVVALLLLVAAPLLVAKAWASPTVSNITGEIERLTLNDPTNVWSGGTVVVGGQTVILPRNLLIDLPANRLTLQQVFAQAPQACRDRSESGLAKVDRCNTAAVGAHATIAANRTNGGDVIAGDVFLEKGQELVSGNITFISYTDGYFRVNGVTGDSSTGVMVRLNDPTGRHTIQQGFGCAGGPNCSADPRFGLDPDNYTNAFSTGYPICLPSTKPRTFVDTLDLNGNGNTTESLTTSSDASGAGDLLCPDANRAVAGQANDSRRFAPLVLGDPVTVKGNFEDVGGAHFLSAYSTKVGRTMTTSSAPGQPDYMVLNDMFIDAPPFARQRIRDQFDGATTEADSDVVLFSVHRDPMTNQAHEFPLATVVGCENAAGPLTCRQVLGPNTFRIRHESLFIANSAKNVKLDACVQLNADPRFSNAGICPQGGTLSEEFGILSPIPHEVQAKTGLKLADDARVGGPTLKTIDVQGRPATNGQFLFPMGAGLGGIEFPNWAEIDINKLDTPTAFDGIPWNLDRRLSPNGCVGPCETTPQPLDPFPFSGADPRAPSPGGSYNDPNYTASTLTNTGDRELSFIDPNKGIFDGDNTILAWPPVDPAPIGVTPTPPPGATKALITGLTPTAAGAGSTVAIDGSGLTGTTAVTFGGVAATTFTNVTDNRVTAVVPAGAQTGPVTVTTPLGPASSAAQFTVVPPPTVSGLNPTSGPAGTGILVSGTGLATTTAAMVNGSAATFTVISDNAVRVVVPANATTGSIVLVTEGGNVTGPTFTVGGMASAPKLTGVSPSSAPVGALVTINGSGLTGATSVTVGGVDDPAFSVSSDMKITAHVPNGATSGLISVTGPGGTATTPFTVTVPPKPVVTGLSPSNGPVGSVVNIVGTGLSGATAVSFNGVASTSISATTDTTVSAVVPTGATTGLVTVTTPYGWSASPTAFTVTAPLPPPPPPAITGWSPGSGPAGTSVTLNGTGFTGATSVTFNGKSATFQVGATGTTITTVVPTGATTGTISVYSPSGVGTSSAPFTVTTANPVPVTPTISSFTPTSGNSGTTVTVIGTNFTGTTAVNIKGTPARSFTVVSSTQINFVVGTGTKTGPVQVITGGGIATSKSNFSIKGKAL